MQLDYEASVVTGLDGETGPTGTPETELWILGPSNKNQLIGAEQSQDWKRTCRRPCLHNIYTFIVNHFPIEQ